MRRVHWSDLATADLRRIKDYLTLNYSADGAQRILDRLILSTDRLLDFPGAGQSLAHADWRKWRPAGLPYVLIYRALANSIEILRVRHAAEDWRPE